MSSIEPHDRQPINSSKVAFLCLHFVVRRRGETDCGVDAGVGVDEGGTK